MGPNSYIGESRLALIAIAALLGFLTLQVGIPFADMYKVQHEIFLQEHQETYDCVQLAHDYSKLEFKCGEHGKNLDFCEETKRDMWANLKIGLLVIGILIGLVGGGSIAYLIMAKGDGK